MAEIDPLVLELVAKVNGYEASLKRATRTVDQQLGMQEKRVKQLENEFRRSSGAISSSLKGLAGTLATAFTGRELVGLIDSYTRLQNSLRVAGLEGEQLAQVQERLRTIGRTYGADLESLASTFSRIAQVQGDLGASTEGIIRLNEIVAASLKVAGTDAQTASGALLQLGQAFGSGVVRAEEFNSILEGALPLAQAAARGIDGFGGSVAKLRTAIAEGEITSRQFFEGVLRGGVQTIKDAQNATLTLSGAFTALRNELTTYVGSNAAATGATGLLANAIGELADNIDLVAEALAVVAVAFTARFAVGAATAATSAIGLRLAALGLAAQLNGTAAAATLTGRALLAAFGGPVGLAIGALTLGFIALQTQARGAEAATGEYKRTLEDARKASDGAREAAERLANSHGKARDEALRAAEAQRELTRQNLATARSSLIAAQAELEKAKAFQKAQNIASFGSTGVPGTGAFIQGRGDSRLANARSNEAAAREAIRSSEESLRLLESTINSAAPPSVNSGVAVSSGAVAGGGGGGGGSFGPDLAAIEQRYLDELDSIRGQIAAAEASTARTAEERAEFELRQLENAERQALRSLDNDADYNDAQKARVRQALESRAAAEREAIAFNLRAEQERRSLELAEERGRAEIDRLRLGFDLADTERERRQIALQVLDAENDLLRSRLEGILASDTANDVERERARIALEALKAQEGAQRASVNRQFATPLERFAINARDTDTLVEEAAVRRIEELNQTITDAMTNALGIKDPFLSQLIKIFLDKNVFGPLAEALSSQGGLGGGGGLLGGIGSLIGGLFGRSSGGFVQAGRPYRVNEGSAPGRVEAFVPNTSGQIIPLGRMNAVAQGGAMGGGVAVVRLDLSGDIDARIERVSGGVAVEVVRQTAPAVIDAAANETIRRANRPAL
ncbi:hypothetical protein [Synechococcus phage Yong-M3-232]|nr:hypothetical protein [Synechococcus phage Yong-M3-232]